MKEGSPAPTLAPEVIATLNLENDRPEWAFLKGERLGIGNLLVPAAGAGQFGLASLFCPGTAGIIAVVEQIWVLCTQLCDFSLRIQNVTATTPGTKQPRDVRLWDPTAVPVTGRLACEVNLGSALGASGLLIGTFGVLAHTTLILQPGIILGNTPSAIGNGRELQIWAATDNLAFQVTFLWRERALEASEAR